MGLREYLASLGSIGESAKSFRESTALDLKKREQETLARALPELIANKDFAGIAAQSLRAGIQDPLNDSVKAMLAQQFPKPGDAPIPVDVLATVTGDPRAAEAIGGLSFDAQKAVIPAFNATRNNAVSRENLELSKDAEGRRVKSLVQQQRDLFASDFDKTEKELNKEEDLYKKLTSAFKRGTVPDDATVQTVVTKVVQGQSGVLTDRDLDRVVPNSFAGDVQKFKNYVFGTAVSSWTPEVRKAVNNAIKDATGIFEDRRDERIRAKLGDAFTRWPSLVGEKGIDPAIVSKAKRLGYEVRRDELGQFEGWEKKQKTTTEIPLNQAVKPDDAAKLANGIKDPKQKNQAIQAIESFKAKGEDVPQFVIDKIRKAL